MRKAAGKKIHVSLFFPFAIQLSTILCSVGGDCWFVFVRFTTAVMKYHDPKPLVEGSVYLVYISWITIL